MRVDEEDDEDPTTSAHAGGGYQCVFDSSDRVFSLSLFGHILEFAQRPGDVTLGHGSVVWEAGVAFSKYMEICNDFSVAALQGKRCLELGSGTGCGGIGLMMRGAQVTFTDLACVVEGVTLPNVTALYGRLRSLGLPINVLPPVVFPLDWTDESGLSKLAASLGSSGGVGGVGGLGVGVNVGVDVDGSVCVSETSSTQTRPVATAAAAPPAPPASLLPPPYDLILLTDCVFSEALVPALLRVITAASHRHTVVYAAHEIRNADANDLFVASMKAAFSSCKQVPRGKQAEGYRHELVQIHVCRRLRG